MDLFGVFGVRWESDTATCWNHSRSLTQWWQCMVGCKSRCGACSWSLCAHCQDAQEGVRRLKPALLPSKFIFLIVHFLYFGLSCVYVPATFVWPSQEDVILHELAQGIWQSTGADVWSQPEVPLLLPWGWDEFSFLYNTFSPKLTGFCPLPLWGASQAHCPGQESPGTDKSLSPEWCPQENPTGVCLGDRWDPHGRAGLTSCVPPVAAWGGQFSAHKDAAIEGI